MHLHPIPSSIHCTLFLLLFAVAVPQSHAADYGLRLVKGEDGTIRGLSFELLNARGDLVTQLGDELSHIEESESLMLIRMKEDKRRITRYFSLDEQFLLPESYEGGSAFAEGLAAVQQNELWGYIDRRGRWVVTPRYERVTDFNDGIARVTYENLDGARWSEHIDKTGKVLPISEFEDIGLFSEGLSLT